MDALGPLRHKLRQLGLGDYPLEAACAPLVERLVADLVSATESYRKLQGQAAGQAQATDTANYQASARAGAAARRGAGRHPPEQAPPEPLDLVHGCRTTLGARAHRVYNVEPE